MNPYIDEESIGEIVFRALPGRFRVLDAGQQFIQAFNTLSEAKAYATEQADTFGTAFSVVDTNPSAQAPDAPDYYVEEGEEG